MSRSDRQHWIMFGAIVGSGLLLAMVADFVYRYPFGTATIVLAAFAVTRQRKPFSAMIDELRYRHHPFACWLREYGLPFAFVGAMACAVWLMFTHGMAVALATAIVLYLADRAAAWLYVRAVWIVNARRQRAADDDDEWLTRQPVQARVVDGDDW